MMKRKTNTLDAAYERRELDRPTQVGKLLGIRRITPAIAHSLGATVVRFPWRGTTVWGASK